MSKVISNSSVVRFGLAAGVSALAMVLAAPAFA